jgi:hypothetical protein
MPYHTRPTSYKNQDLSTDTRSGTTTEENQRSDGDAAEEEQRQG